MKPVFKKGGAAVTAVLVLTCLLVPGGGQTSNAKTDGGLIAICFIRSLFK